MENANSTPTYLTGKRLVNIPAQRVAEVPAMIHGHGHTE